jgi:septal ring factor EnvC (AmiA/AmiB activator)
MHRSLWLGLPPVRATFVLLSCRMGRITSIMAVLGVIAALLLSTAAGAQTLPIPGKKDDVFTRAAPDLSEHRAREKRLKTQLSAIDNEINDLRGAMVKIAKNVRRQESDLNKLENQIDGLQSKKTKLERRLANENKDTAALAMALVRLRDIPPEALVARPGAPIDAAETAMILQGVVAPVRARALSLSQDLQDIVTLETTLTERRTALKTAAEKILADQTKLADLVRRRERAYQGIQNDLAVQEQELTTLAKDAADFKDFIHKLERRNQELAEAPQKRSFVDVAVPKKISSRLPRELGGFQMPIDGAVRIKFGATDDMGAESHGVRIEGRPGGLVVAPMTGIIRFKGHFKNYGNIVIIEHAKNYHSLVAGLSKIDTVVGQSVSAGEPLGALAPTRTAKPSMYYELRRNGKPINPAQLSSTFG